MSDIRDRIDSTVARADQVLAERLRREIAIQQREDAERVMVVGAHAVLFHRKPHTDPLRMWAKRLIEKKPFKLVAVAFDGRDVVRLPRRRSL